MGTPYYNKLEKELGFNDAANEYIEVFLRNIESLSLSESEFQLLAEKAGIKVNNYDVTQAASQIRKSYIIAVYKAFESFMIDLDTQAKKYAVSYSKKEDGESLLKCLYKNFLDISKKNEASYCLFLICDYYRLIRNYYAHKENISDIENAYKRLVEHVEDVKEIFGNLNVPNSLDKISFDDFILYSRAVKKLAKIFSSSITFSASKIAENYQISKIARCVNSTEKMEKKIAFDLSMNFPLEKNQVDEITQIILSRC